MNPDKIDDNLLSQMQAADSQDGLPVIIRRKGEMFFSQAIGDVVDFRLLDANAMLLQAQDIESLSDDDNIEYIWADLPVRAFLDVSVPALGVPQVWDTGHLGAGVRLAIIDTGLDTTNPDFEGRVIATESFISGEGPDDDLNGHGTHVAGIAAGSGVASDSKYRGVAPEASLFIAKVLDRNGSGSMSGVMSGIEWAVEQGAQVINLSLGSSGPCDGTDALSTLCDAAVTQEGVTLCVAAGNDGPGASTVGSPGCANEVITIGSVNERNQVSGFHHAAPRLITASNLICASLVM